MKNVLRFAVLLLVVLAGALLWRLVQGPSLDPRHVAIQELKQGAGAPLEDGSQVTVQYVTRIRGGAVVSESRKSGQPFTFVVGAGQVLPGWEEGVRGMREGGIRRILIPPGLAYGAKGSGGTIPPDAVLETELELLKVAAPKAAGAAGN